MTSNSTDRLGIQSSLIGVSKALERSSESDQVQGRSIGVSVGGGVKPPYPPDQLAGLLELNGTHAICVQTKAHREVGFGFEVVPHPRVDPEEASEDERERAEDFWFGRNTKWKLSPSGTSTANPTEVKEMGRQDYHGVGWLSLEIMYAGYDDEPAGMTYLPAKTIRRAKAGGDGKVGRGFVQKRDGQTVHLAEAGDRHREGIDGDSDPRYVDKESGDVYKSREAMESDGAEPANEVLFVPNPHPGASETGYGIPAWVAEVQTMVADQEARRYNRKRLENDLMLDYVVIVEGGELTEKSREEVREHINGLRESNEPGAWILEADDLTEDDSFNPDVDSNVSIRVEPMAQFGDEEMSWIEYRDANERDIAQVHEVPRQMLGHQDATNANTEEAVRQFTQEVIKPNQEQWSDRVYRTIHQQILDVHDWTIAYNTVGAEDDRRQTEISSMLVDAVGPALTAGQALEQFGLEPDESIEGLLLSEIGGGGGMGDVLQQEIDNRVDEAVDGAVTNLETERLIQQGAEADD